MEPVRLEDGYRSPNQKKPRLGLQLQFRGLALRHLLLRRLLCAGTKGEGGGGWEVKGNLFWPWEGVRSVDQVCFFQFSGAPLLVLVP